MYWNICYNFRNRHSSRRLIETWDVLKLHQIHLRYSGFPGINRNMRCIEIITVYGNRGIVERLIETWDVLKYKLVNVYTFCFCRLIETWDVLKCNLTNYIISSDSINRNMRCIEISSAVILSAAFAINRNMRCIEIVALNSVMHPLPAD